MKIDSKTKQEIMEAIEASVEAKMPALALSYIKQNNSLWIVKNGDVRFWNEDQIDGKCSSIQNLVSGFIDCSDELTEECVDGVATLARVFELQSKRLRRLHNKMSKLRSENEA